MHKIKFIFELIIFSIVAISLFTVFLYNNFNTDNSAIDDSSAIFGGKTETGYPSAGYLVTYETPTTITTCGLVYITNEIAITAAHCVEEGKTFYAGIDEFSYLVKDNFDVQGIYFHPNWDGKDSSYDIAVLEVDAPANLPTASMVSPSVGCDYEIIGYGSTEIDKVLDPGVRLRKSYELCIDALTEKNIYFSGQTGGVCFGDSGSPIFKKGTNEVVGVLSAVFPLPGTSDKYCDIGNNALGVRLDRYDDYIASYTDQTNLTLAACSESCSQNAECAEGLTCQNGICLTTSGSCVVASGGFCSSKSSINCLEGSSCVFNECIEKTNVSANEITDQVLEFTSSVSFLDANRNVLIAFTLLVSLVNFFIILKSLSKRRQY